MNGGLSNPRFSSTALVNPCITGLFNGEAYRALKANGETPFIFIPFILTFFFNTFYFYTFYFYTFYFYTFTFYFYTFTFYFYTFTFYFYLLLLYLLFLYLLLLYLILFINLLFKIQVSFILWETIVSRPYYHLTLTMQYLHSSSSHLFVYFL
jgi:hypothetical protein